MPGQRRARTGMPHLAVDETVDLEIGGSTQRIRTCAARPGLPPLVIVQGGPGFPLLDEVARFQRLLRLEESFRVSYWEQRGCGNASRQDAASVSLDKQVDDLRAVLRWIHHATGQRAVVFGISLGGTFSLQAAAREPDKVRAVIAISPDADNAASDASVDAFLRAKAARPGGRRLSRKLRKLEAPPYTTPAPFQRRARLLTDLGTVERGRTFGAVLTETLLAMIGTYGISGTAAAMRNMNEIQRRLLPPLASLNLFASGLRVPVPVHYAFGGRDLLVPESVAERLPGAIAAPRSTVLRVPDAGHMVHFDAPDALRSIALRARDDD